MKIDFLFFFILLVFFSMLWKSFHVLSFLISIEMSMVLLFLYLINHSVFYSYYVVLVFIAFAASESALGLTLFVLMGRSFSKDYLLNMFNLSF